MSIRFMLQPEGEAYWRVADDDEEAVLNQFCDVNGIPTTTKFDDNGLLPVMCHRGTDNDLDLQKYIKLEIRNYKIYVDGHGSQFNLKREFRARVPLFIEMFIEKRKKYKMIARPYEERFIDPILRPADSGLYQVSVPYSKHGPARGGGAGRR